MSQTKRPKFVKRERPRVVVCLKDPGSFMHTIVGLAREWDWDLLDYSLVYGVFPDDPRPRGAITDSLWDTPLVQQFYNNGCSIIRLGQRRNPYDHVLPAILPDLEMAGQLAARHFMEKGFERLIYVGWNAGFVDSDSNLFYESFRDCAVSAGCDVQLYDMRDHHVEDEEPAVRFARRQREIGGWLKMTQKPVGVMTYSDSMAAQLCMICRNKRMRVPEEVAILGFGNTTWCERAPVELSSVVLSDEERARKAMYLLRDMMDGKITASGAIMVPPAGIHQRRSTDILAIEDLAVARALRFIWEHSMDSISVHDVARDIGMSERQLERRFLRVFGESMNQKIVERRMDEIKRLLRTTDLTVTDICTKTGFRSARHLHHAFRKHEGMTPLKYRQSRRADLPVEG